MRKPLVRAALACAVLTLAAGPAAAQLGDFFKKLQDMAPPAPAQSQAPQPGVEMDRAAVKEAAAAFAAPHEEWARPLMQALYEQGEWAAVLNLQRLGLAAMEHGRFNLARKAFDEAIARVEEIYAGDANAEKARSLFNGESVKDFKGEPYERAMLYYYRGLLYVQEGDFQNARAAFLAADRHITLSSAESAVYQSDFGMLKYLAGWASSCDNDRVRGEHLVEEARAVDSKIQSLEQTPGAALVLVESGPAPVKWGDGQYKHILKFKPGTGPDTVPRIRTSAGRTVGNLPLAGDLVYQATTRGGREVDGIMAGKANFKGNAAAVGDVGVTVGTQAAMMGAALGDGRMGGVGLAGIFIGVAAKAIEASANPAADIRAWDTLPARIHLYSAALDERAASRPAAPAGKAPTKTPVKGRAPLANAKVAPAAFAPPAPPMLVIEDKPQPMLLVTVQGRCSLAWGRTDSAPPVVQPVGEKFNPESSRGDRNKALRQMLETEFVAGK